MAKIKNPKNISFTVSGNLDSSDVDSLAIYLLMIALSKSFKVSKSSVLGKLQAAKNSDMGNDEPFVFAERICGHLSPGVKLKLALVLDGAIIELHKATLITDLLSGVLNDSLEYFTTSKVRVPLNKHINTDVALGKELLSFLKELEEQEALMAASVEIKARREIEKHAKVLASLGYTVNIVSTEVPKTPSSPQGTLAKVNARKAKAALVKDDDEDEDEDDYNDLGNSN